MVVLRRGLATLRTPLYGLHARLGAKFVVFAGYDMPVQYAALGILDSHAHTRTRASLFDVSHMLQLQVVGPQRAQFIERLTPADFSALGTNHAALSVYTNAAGGIIDDLVLTRKKDAVYVVSNAGCRDKDLAHLRNEAAAFDVDIRVMDAGLLALQGPMSAAVLEKLVKTPLSDLKFMSGREMRIGAVPVYVTRCGYTGEDGFEISAPADAITAVAETILKHDDVEMAGLGARDSLRLEAGLCLYGHDIDDATTPVEAGLAWTIAKRRRETGGFIGSDKILAQLRDKSNSVKRAGLFVQGAPAREGAKIFQGDNEVGRVTSGCPSPTLRRNIAMGYVAKQLKVGDRVDVVVRGKRQPAEVAKMPFVETRYFK